MFTHLHNHTKFSILDALCKIKPMVKKAKDLGQNALAITDHGVVYGWIEFYKECMEQGIKPILGCELYVAPYNIHHKDNHERYHHLVAIAETNTGMDNLKKLCTAGFTQGGLYYGKPRVDDDLIEKYKEGIIFLSGCVAGRIPQLILKGEEDRAEQEALKYRDMFGKDNFFLEIQNHGDEKERIVTDGLVRISKKTGIPLVATNDCHYINSDDEEAHEVLLYMRDGKTIHDPTSAYGNGQLYLKSEEEMRSLFPFAPEAIDNTVRIADRCNVSISFHETKMPKAPIPAGEDAYDYLKKLCCKGLKERYPKDDGTVMKQLEYELSVIKNMGFVEYFLVVWEYINWSRNNGVTVGPGRGSAAGSIAMYCLGITDIEPKRFDLVFERFLNPERVSMPDIDEDFDDANRYKTIDHVRDLYGNDNVCQIITFGTMAARKVIKAVGKVYGYEVPFYNNLATLVPKDPYITLSKALEEVPDFKNTYETDADARKIIDMGLKLEGLPCNTSKHAAGVIIADRPVGEYIPLALTKDGDLVSQFNMVEIEELGLLKMDFLGLKTLTVIDDALRNIKASKGIDIKVDDIPYDDAEVYKFISTGKTSGVFQLESGGMMSFMKQLKPTSLEDLIAGISLYRPGPMDFIPKYIEGKNNQKNISYSCPQLEPILAPTYGCIVYQEQVMQIFQQLAGYSLGGADNIRRAMSKKKQHVIAQEQETFIYGNLDTEKDPKKQVKGCVANGISKEAATEIYYSMTDFAKYAFNKSHAACYAAISYRTAWLKYYYPAEYMAAVMTAFIDNKDKLVPYMNATKEQGIKILPPHVNYSTDKCLPAGNTIRMPLSMIKGVGTPVVADIINTRNNGFASFEDFILSDIEADKTAVGALINAGAFDGLGYNRRTLAENYIDILAHEKKQKKDTVEGQMSLFDVFEEMKPQRLLLKEYKEYADKKKLALEKEVLGVYASAHPLDAFVDVCKKYNNCSSFDFVKDDETGIANLKKGDDVAICALVKEIKKTWTKNGKEMAFVLVEDTAGDIEVVVFPETYAQVKGVLVEDECYLISGTASESKDDEKPLSIILKDIKRADELPFKLWVRIPTEDDIEKTNRIIDGCQKEINSPGQVHLYVNSTKKIIKTNKKAALQNKQRFEELFGKDNVAIN